MTRLTACTALDSPEVSETRGSLYICLKQYICVNAFPPFPVNVLRLIRYLAFTESNNQHFIELYDIKQVGNDNDIKFF